MGRPTAKNEGAVVLPWNRLLTGDVLAENVKGIGQAGDIFFADKFRDPRASNSHPYYEAGRRSFENERLIEVYPGATASIERLNELVGSQRMKVMALHDGDVVAGSVVGLTDSTDVVIDHIEENDHGVFYFLADDETRQIHRYQYEVPADIELENTPVRRVRVDRYSVLDVKLPLLVDGLQSHRGKTLEDFSDLEAGTVLFFPHEQKMYLGTVLQASVVEYMHQSYLRLDVFTEGRRQRVYLNDPEGVAVIDGGLPEGEIDLRGLDGKFVHYRLDEIDPSAEKIMERQTALVADGFMARREMLPGDRLTQDREGYGVVGDWLGEDGRFHSHYRRMYETRTHYRVYTDGTVLPVERGRYLSFDEMQELGLQNEAYAYAGLMVGDLLDVSDSSLFAGENIILTAIGPALAAGDQEIFYRDADNDSVERSAVVSSYRAEPFGFLMGRRWAATSVHNRLRLGADTVRVSSTADFSKWSQLPAGVWVATYNQPEGTASRGSGLGAMQIGKIVSVEASEQSTKYQSVLMNLEVDGEIQVIRFDEDDFFDVLLGQPDCTQDELFTRFAMDEEYHLSDDGYLPELLGQSWAQFMGETVATESEADLSLVNGAENSWELAAAENTPQLNLREPDEMGVDAEHAEQIALDLGSLAQVSDSGKIRRPSIGTGQKKNQQAVISAALADAGESGGGLMSLSELHVGQFVLAQIGVDASPVADPNSPDTEFGNSAEALVYPRVLGTVVGVNTAEKTVELSAVSRESERDFTVHVRPLETQEKLRVLTAEQAEATLGGC
ncbi:hypothetical protein [Rothia amarae]|uniref:hypothetical protein n=1 Tax=Rothia amarae TaxID=169480 RepID=UPI001247ACBC